MDEDEKDEIILTILILINCVMGIFMIFNLSSFIEILKFNLSLIQELIKSLFT